MRSDAQKHNLSGMKCSTSLIRISLEKYLLQHHSSPLPLLGGKSSKALTVSTEIVTPTYHYGDGCVFLLQNYLFICGGTDIESSNKWTDGPKV